MDNARDVVQQFVAPVVMISACGLLCLALYNRLAVIVARARAFNKERLECQEELAEHPGTARLEKRAVTLDHQFNTLFERARLVRAALYALLTTIGCMLLCSLSLGMGLVAKDAAYLALVFFVGGTLSALAAVVFAVRELRRALDPVAVEEMSLHEFPGVPAPPA